MRIFLIDDDLAFSKAIATFLEMQGHEVLTASDPSQCAVYGNDNTICPHADPCGDILLIDQNMPNMTGLEFIRLQIERGCKGIAKNRAVMSANLSVDETRMAIELGCTLFKKPFRMKSLLEWIEGVQKRLPPERRLVNFE